MVPIKSFSLASPLTRASASNRRFDCRDVALKRFDAGLILQYLIVLLRYLAIEKVQLLRLLWCHFTKNHLLLPRAANSPAKAKLNSQLL